MLTSQRSKEKGASLPVRIISFSPQPFLLFALLLLLFSAQKVLAQGSRPAPYVNVSKVVSPPGCGEDSYFGETAAMSTDGTTTAVSCPYGGGPLYLGLVSVLVRNPATGQWTIQAMLNGTNKDYDSTEGSALAIDARGNTVASTVRFNFGDSNRVYIYVRSNGGLWTQQATIAGIIGVDSVDNFGGSVALSADGNTLAATSDVYVFFFTRSGSTWSQQGPEIGFDPLGSFNIALSADGNTAAVISDTAAYVEIMTRSGVSWTLQGSVLRLNPDIIQLLAFAQNSQLLFGAGEISMYPFRRAGLNYNQANEGVTASFDIEALVATASGETVIAGTDNVDEVQVMWTNSTADLIYETIQTITRPANCIGSFPKFGTSLGVSGNGNFLVIGAETDEEGGNGAGAVFFYERIPVAPACRPAFDIDRARCQVRIEGCLSAGIRLKWTGKGCRRRNRPVGDGGCQCAGYCGYTCRNACKKDRECQWKQGLCFVKATNTPGGPITQCS